MVQHSKPISMKGQKVLENLNKLFGRFWALLMFRTKQICSTLITFWWFMSPLPNI